MPPIRVLAERLLINPNTVARAYRELEVAGIVVKRRTAGTFVSDAGSPLARRERLKILTERIDALLAESSPDECRHRRNRPTHCASATKVCNLRLTLRRNEAMIANVSAVPDPVVEVKALTRRFGAKAALDDVSITIPRGIVFGLVGANGAGKTTLIKHVLGLLKAAEPDRWRVFDLDPVADPAAVLSRIGYVSEEHDLPAWMRVWELLRYNQAFFPNWDAAYAEDLRRRFDLDPTPGSSTF